MTISPRGEARKLRAGDSTTNKPKEHKMHTASREWADRVAARNAVETAKARADEARINEELAAQGFLPLTYGEQLIPLSAAGKEAE